MILPGFSDVDDEGVPPGNNHEYDTVEGVTEGTQVRTLALGAIIFPEAIIQTSAIGFMDISGFFFTITFCVVVKVPHVFVTDKVKA